MNNLFKSTLMNNGITIKENQKGLRINVESIMVLGKLFGLKNGK